MKRRSGSFKFAVLGSVFAIIALIAGCTSPLSMGDSLRGPALRIGVSPDYPPVIFEHDGEIVGIEGDLARGVGKALDRPIEFVRIPFPELLDALEGGEVDVVMSGLSITRERAQRAAFTTPYMQVGQLALIRTSEIGRFGRIHHIRRAGVRVGYQRATSGEQYVADGLPRAESFAFDTIDAGLRSLRGGRIDYFVHDAPTIWRLAGDLRNRDLHGLYRPLTKEELAWAVRTEDVQLRALLDATLSHWKREGLIEPIVQRWIPVRITQR